MLGRTILNNMKHLTFLLALIVLGTIGYAQAPVPRKITVKGDFVDRYDTELANGDAETVIACTCSESTCYTISVGTPNSTNGPQLDTDCGGTGIDLIAPNTFITIKLMDGTILSEGVFISYHNYPSGENLLLRDNVFILK